MISSIYNKVRGGLKAVYMPYKKRLKDKKLAKRSIYSYYYNKCKINDNMVLYMSYYGRGMICNPYAIFKELIKDDEFRNLTHVWVLDKFENHKKLIEEYKNNSHVIFVEEPSIQFLKYLCTAKYLISNVSFHTFFTKKERQIYINTWHGIPLKTLGYDLPDGKISISNVVRTFLQSDYLISANKFTTKIYKDAYKMQSAYEGKIIEEGYPRNDGIFNTDRNEILDKLIEYGVNIERNKKIILYAPTWKGAEYAKPDTSVESYFNFVEIIGKYVNLNEYQILIKPHQIVYKHLLKLNVMTDIFIPATIDTNELLSVTDILVSDYSSIYFDFMDTNRPIFFYIPDIEEYKGYRGLYFPMEELPGPYTDSLEQIGEWISDIENSINPYKDIYNKVKQWACEYDDGNATKRIIDIVFRGNTDRYNIISCLDSKKKILIHHGNAKTNGITSSLINLTNSIDYNKYDVTVTITANNDEEKKNVEKLNDNSRVMVRNSTYNATVLEDVRINLIARLGWRSKLGRKIHPDNLFTKEFLRCFGDTKFDYVIDFSGYGWFFCYLLLASPTGKKFIWLHNDMIAERDRIKDGHVKLKNIATTYDYYDKIVSCSKSVMEVNRQNLANKNNYEKFTYAKNTINYKKIEERLNENNILIRNDNEYYIKKEIVYKNGGMRLELIPNVDDEYVNFITLGRLSPEKNHLNLIEAFTKLCAIHPNCRLYILGEGPLQNKTNSKILKNGMADKIFLTGNVQNPFGLMKQCDCFVLPSNHEGQPMVVLEARCLKMPIIISKFSTLPDCLVENGQLIVEKEVDDIFEGLLAFIEGKVNSSYEFDPIKYNLEAYNEFTCLLD